jgi:hypothetical protein
VTEHVPADQIEQIVGVERHPNVHYGRAVSAQQIVYILHSQGCLDSTPDLRDCAYSRALDRGIDLDAWVEDEPVALMIEFDGRLFPAEDPPW